MKSGQFEKMPIAINEKWQEITDILAELYMVPSALIIKSDKEFMNVLFTNKSDNNPFKSGDKMPITGTFCEEVMKIGRCLIVPNSSKVSQWANCPLSDLGIVAFCGLPLNFPDGNPFGTICLLDNKENSFSGKHEHLLKHFKNILEIDLAVLQSADEKNINYGDDLAKLIIKKCNELKKAKEEVERREQHYKNLYENFTDAVFFIDKKERKILSANTTAILTYGYTEEEFSELDLKQLFPSADGNSIRKRIKSVMDTGSAIFESVLKTKDNRLVPVEIKGKKIDNKTLIAVARDISKRRMLEHDLLIANNRFELAVKGSNDGIWDLNIETQELYFSDRCKEQLGYDYNDMVTHFSAFMAHLHPEDKEEFMDHFNKCVSGEIEKYNIVYRLLHKNGSYVWIHGRGVALRDGNGKAYRMAGSHTDITNNKIAEEKLVRTNRELNLSKRKVEERTLFLKSIFASMSDLLFVIDRNDMIIEYNSPQDNPQTILPYNQFINRNYREILPESLSQKIESAILQIKTTEEPQQFDYSLNFNENTYWYNAKLSGLKNTSGKFDGVTAICRDITDKVDNQRKIIDSHKLLNNLANQVPGVLYQHHYRPGGPNYFPFASKNCFDLFNVTPEEAKKDAWNILSLIHPEDIDNVQKQFLESYQNLTMWEQVYRIVHPIKGVRWLHCYTKPERMEDGSVIWHGYIRDETQTKEIELAFEEKSRVLEQFFNVNLDLLCIADTEGNFIKLNKAWESILGYPIEELEQKKFHEFVHPEDLKKTIESLSKLNEQSDVVNFVNRFKGKDGTYRFIEWHSHPVENTIYAAARDITERIATETKLKELNATKDKLFSIISHDLKSPFNSLIGLSELLENNADEYTVYEIKSFGKMMNNSSTQAYKLLENLLHWSRMQTGNMKFNPEEAKPSELISDVVQLSTQIAKSKTIELKTAIKTDETIFGDTEMIKTVIRNLVSNAIKFTRPRGKVTIGTQKEGSSVIFSVSDTGIGIAPEHIPMLFTLNNEILKTGTANETGTGLGLILCKEFVEKNGGKIWVESTPEKGSIFKFTIPLTKAS